MNKYQDEFAIRFAQIMQQNLLKWKALKREVIVALYSPSAFAFYFTGFICGFVPGKHETAYLQNLGIHFWIGVFLFMCAVFIYISSHNKEYQNKIKRVLFPKLLQVFDKSLRYKGKDSVIERELYNRLCLFSTKVVYRGYDDSFSGSYDGVEFKICEVETLQGKKRVSKTKEEIVSLFGNGIAMHFKLNKGINSHVIISTKFNLHRIPKNYEKVVVEYENFNKKYNVWVANNSNGQVEARYLLNTAFLDRFMQLQTSFGVGKMSCYVKGDDMLILLSKTRDLFEMNHLFRRIDDVKQYKHLFEEFASVLSFIEVLNLGSKTKL